MGEKRVELFISCAAIAISLAAIALSWWQLEVGREHNRLSVRPLLVVTPYLEGPGGRNGIYLSNEGLGPAILESIGVSTKAKVYSGLGMSQWREILKTLDIEPLCFALGWPTRESVLKAGEAVALLERTKADAPACVTAMPLLLMKRSLLISIRYTSLYNETFEISASAGINDRFGP